MPGRSVLDDFDLGGVLTGSAPLFMGNTPMLTSGTAALAPTSAEAFHRAAALHDAGKFAEAEVLLRDAIAYDPGNSDLRNARGVMFAAMGRDLDALWCYRDAIACNPGGAGIWTNLGNAQ